MNSFLKAKTELMVSNFRKVKKELRLESNYARNVIALHHAIKGREVNVARIIEIKEYIKNRTSPWKYYFRGYSLNFLANLLSFEDDYQQACQNMLNVFEKIKALTVFKSSFLLLASLVIAKNVQPSSYDEAVAKMKLLYQRMYSHHKFLTNQYDYGLIAYFIAGNYDLDKTLGNIEFCFGYLHEHGFSIGKDLYVVSN
jgi:hypothetical protein